MKKLFVAFLFFTSVITNNLFAAAYGETGSEVESFKVKIKFELVKDDGSKVTVLDGTQFLETVSGQDVTAFGDNLEGVKPDAGTYTGVVITVTDFEVKAKIVSAGTTYYTTTNTVTQDNVTSWQLSTSESNYGITTVNAPGDGYESSTTFPKPLTVADDSNVSIIYLNKYKDVVRYETAATVADSTWIGAESLIRAVLPEVPAKVSAFDIAYNDASNTITIFSDSEGNVIGGACNRPSTQAINGSTLISASSSGSTYSLRFVNGDDNDDGVIGNDYYDVTVTLDCTNSSFSGLGITKTTDGVSDSDVYDYGDGGADTVATPTGSLTCESLSLN